MKKAIKENKLNWRSWYDGRGGPIVKEFGVRAFPTIFLVDHTGVIRYKNVRDKKLLDQAIEELVAKAEDAGMTGGAEPNAKMREFIDVTGKYKTNAAYVGFEDGKVILRKEDKSEIKVAFNKLSFDDRHYVAVKRLTAEGNDKAAEVNENFAFDEPHTFTSVDGDQVLGTYIALKGGKAVIWKADGSQVSIPWGQLSDESKDYIKQEIKRLK